MMTISLALLVVTFAVVGTTITGLFLLVALMALAIFGTRKLLPMLRERRKPATPEERALSTATTALAQACTSFTKRLKEAHSDISSTERTYTKAIAASEKRLKQAQTVSCLGHAGGIKVYEDRIATPEGEHPMDEQVKAVVDDAGVIAVTRRHTVTRFALLGPLSLFTPKATKHDNRELYFLVEHPRWASLVKLNPNAGMAARKVCVTLNLAARQATANRTARKQQIGDATDQLAEARANRTGIDLAEKNLEQVTVSFADVEENRLAMAALISPCSDNSSLVKRATKMMAKAEALRSG